MKALIVICLGLLLLACSSPEPEQGSGPKESKPETALEHAKKHLDPTYVCPMHPQIVRDEPGTCPICGMDLAEQEIDPNANREAPVITISPQTRQNMGVRTQVAKSERLWKYIQTIGYIGYDEDRMHHVHSRVEGWVEKLHVRAEGDKVERGQLLLALYSPEAVAAQEEYLVARKRGDSKLFAGSGRSLKQAATKRLQLLDIPRSLIDRLKNTGQVQHRIPMHAPIGGVITRLNIREGMFVTPKLRQFTIADLSSVWVIVEVFEHQMSWVEPGKVTEIQVDAYPDRVWEGRVDYIYSELDPQTRALKVRLRFPNQDSVLKPNMLARAVIYGGPHDADVSIPREALIRTGERSVVVKALGDGKFQPVTVRVGLRSGERIEIRSGLEAGDRIVVSGQFLIDSESSLQASFLRFGEAD
jgi:Cu(I)/Ag(I) efflux system membrane fusion protein